MLQARSERSATGLLWVPGMTPWPTMEAGSARAQEIARRREEMLGMLHDLPESESELSLTDLVEKAGAGGDGGEAKAEAAPAPKTEGKDPGAARSASSAQQQPAPAGRPERRASAGQRERRRGQLPQQQRRRPAQLLHAEVAHPELHRAAPHPDAVLLRLPEPQRRIRMQQEGEGPRRRDRQVLVVAWAVAQVEPAGPGRAAQRERVHHHPRRVGRHPQSGQALRSAG